MAEARLAVIATLTKGYDLDYIWRQVDRDLAKDAAGYYLQASETGGEPPGRWWGPGAQALGLEPGQVVEQEPYDLLFGQRKAPDGTPLGRPPGDGRKAADIYAGLLAGEPHAIVVSAVRTSCTVRSFSGILPMTASSGPSESRFASTVFAVRPGSPSASQSTTAFSTV
jgi:hypothetical protein